MNRIDLKEPLTPIEWLKTQENSILSVKTANDISIIEGQYMGYTEYLLDWIPMSLIASKLVCLENCTGNLRVYNNVLGMEQSFYVKCNVDYDKKTVEVVELYKEGIKIHGKDRMWEAMCFQLGFEPKPF